jgi:sugar-specific transcriptional regulator TrmB
MYMTEVEKLLLKLQKFELSDLEIKLYLTLLAYGTLTTVQAADHSGIPRPRAYDELASLERKGLVIRAATKPMKYSAISPKESFQRLKSRIKDDYSKRTDELSSTADSLVDDLQPLFEKRAVGPTDIAWVVSGASNVREELAEMAQKAEKTLFISYEPSLDLIHRTRGWDVTAKKLKNKGVKIAALFDLSPSAVEHAAKINGNQSFEIRFGERPFKPLGVYSAGGKQTLIAYQSNPASPTYDIALNLAESPLTTMLHGTIKELWERGVSLSEAKKKLKKD